MRPKIVRYGMAAAMIALAAPLSAHGHQSPPSRSAASTVDAFHAALGRGDTRAAAALLSADALIFESGGAERTKAEYSAHHLREDAEFSKAVPSSLTRRTTRVEGSSAWVASEGRTTGTFHGKPLDLVTTETMVLRRAGGAWKIVHIHWSSARKSP